MWRGNIINKFIRSRGYAKYLEIGVDNGKHFDSIMAEYKVGVDPSKKSKATVCQTSDEYFSSCDEKFDIIFIDGLHLCEQVYRDIGNSLNHLNPGGVVVLHDLLPPNEKRQLREWDGVSWWNGDCWKAFVKYRHSSPYLCYTIDVDEGCGVIDTTKANETDNSALPTDMDAMTWNDFVENRDVWMNVKPDVVE